MRLLKRQTRKAILLLLLCILLTAGGCSDTDPDTPVTTPIQPDEPFFSLTDADTATSADDARRIDLDQFSGECVITQPGSYILSGSLEGTLVVDAQEQIVHLVLDGVSVHSRSGPALNVLSAGKLILTLAEGSENRFRDSGTYPAGAEEDACIFSVCDLTVNGSGKLDVYGYHKDAIHTKDVLKLLGGNIILHAKRDGLHGNDGIAVCCNALDVQCERNGLHTTKTGASPKGNIEIYSGDCSVIAGKYAVSCIGDLRISGCRLYTMGVYGDFSVSGTQNIDRECLDHE